MLKYFILILSVLLQGLVPLINLPALAVVGLAIREESAGRAYLIAVLTGLLADLALGSPLGLFAGLYLIMVFVMVLFKSRFRFNFYSAAAFLLGSQLILFYVRGIFG